MRTIGVIAVVGLLGYFATANAHAIRDIVRLGGSRHPKGKTFTLLGSYSNVHTTPERVYGYLLEMWMADDGTVEGRWTSANGEEQDFPITRISDVIYNESTGQLQFTARWCGYVQQFDGTLTGDDVEGTLRQVPVGTGTAGASNAASAQTLTLLRERSTGPLSKSEWDIQTSDLVKRLGPKC